MSEKDKLHNCELYLPMGEEIMSEQLQCLDKLYDFNATRPTELDKRTALLKDMLAEVGKRMRQLPFNLRRRYAHLHRRLYDDRS